MAGGLVVQVHGHGCRGVCEGVSGHTGGVCACGCAWAWVRVCGCVRLRVGV